MRQFCFNILLGLDQFVNVLLLGDPDESISERLGRAHMSGKPKFFVEPFKKLVDAGARIIAKQHNHCIESIVPGETYPKELWSWEKK